MLSGSEGDMDDDDDDEDARSDTLDTLDMPSTLNSLINCSVENGLDKTPVPTELNDEMNGNPLQKLDLNDIPVQMQGRLEFTNDDSWRNVIQKNPESQVLTPNSLSFNQSSNIAPLKVECDPVSFIF